VPHKFIVGREIAPLLVKAVMEHPMLVGTDEEELMEMMGIERQKRAA
jgi:hypothetical protein